MLTGREPTMANSAADDGNEPRKGRNGNAGGTRDIVVIGGSAGSIEATIAILKALPGDFPAAILIVVHTGQDAPNYLANIFAKVSNLPVQYAADHEPIELGRVYVAAPDRHLLIKPGEMRVILGPKENNFRPAIDPLFRTAATTYHGRVIGVVLSGSLDDGTHGLLQIKRAGGVTIVQSPEDALQRQMPESAIDRVNVHHILPAGEIGSLLAKLVSGNGNVSSAVGQDEVDVAEGLVSSIRMNGMPAPAPFVCPECKGALWEVHDGDAAKYRCHVGHGFATDTLLALQAIEIEQALWSAVRAFDERAALQKRTAERTDIGNPELRRRLLEASREQQRMADVVRRLLVGPDRIEQEIQQENVGELVRREYGA
jgi:two-component system chemotaxis response regulator CheB